MKNKKIKEKDWWYHIIFIFACKPWGTKQHYKFEENSKKRDWHFIFLRHTKIRFKFRNLTNLPVGEFLL